MSDFVRLAATWTVERTSTDTVETVNKDRLVNLDDVRCVTADAKGRAVLHWRTPNVMPTTLLGQFEDVVGYITERSTP